MRRVLGYASRYLMTKNGVLGVGCIGLSLVFALLISSCAPVSHDYIGTWNRQPDKLTYVNYDQHIKVTFPNDKWKVYTKPPRGAPGKLWKRPTKANPSYYVMLARFQDAPLMMEVLIEPAPIEMSLNEYLDFEIERIKLDKHNKIKAESINSGVVERNDRTIGLLQAEAEGGLILFGAVFKEEGRFTLLTFSFDEIIYIIIENQIWAIVNSYEYID